MMNKSDVVGVFLEVFSRELTIPVYDWTDESFAGDRLPAVILKDTAEQFDEEYAGGDLHVLQLEISVLAAGGNVRTKVRELEQAVRSVIRDSKNEFLERIEGFRIKQTEILSDVVEEEVRLAGSVLKFEVEFITEEWK